MLGEVCGAVGPGADDADGRPFFHVGRNGIEDFVHSRAEPSGGSGADGDGGDARIHGGSKPAGCVAGNWETSASQNPASSFAL